MVSAVGAVLGAMGLLASTVALWAHWTILDADRTASAVDEALERAEVTDALADAVSKEVDAIVDIEDRVDEEDHGDRVAAVADGANAWLEQELAKILADDPAQDALHAVVEVAHGALMRVLDGEPVVAGVRVSEGVVTLNVLPLVGLSLERLQSLGLLEDVVLPQLETGGDADEQRAALAGALGRELPADFGELVVYRDGAPSSEQAQVSAARDLVELVQRAVWVILLLTPVAITAALVAARDRRSTVLALTAGVCALFVAAALLLGRVVDAAPASVEGVAAKVAVSEVVSSLTSSLTTVLWTVVGLAAATLLIAGIVAGLHVLDRRGTTSTGKVATGGRPNDTSAALVGRLAAAGGEPTAARQAPAPTTRSASGDHSDDLRRGGRRAGSGAADGKDRPTG